MFPKWLRPPSQTEHMPVFAVERAFFLQAHMDLSTVDKRMEELARKAIKRSGGQFFNTLQKRVTAYIETLVAGRFEADDFEFAQDVTLANLILLARHYAGEITSGKKRKRGGAPTNAEKVKTLLENTLARLVLDVIVLAAHMEAAQNECSNREALADESEHWARDYADVDPADMWATRNEAIDMIKSSWDDAAHAAKSCDWEALVSAMDELNELDA